MVNSAYEDQPTLNQTWCRTFSTQVPESELVWHLDANHRHVTILSGEGWQLQLDNQLPQLLEKDHEYQIPAHVYHRVIKGETDLVIKIRES